MLQETHSTKNVNVETSWSSPLKCENVCNSHGESNARGVWTAFHNDLDIKKFTMRMGDSLF